MNDEKALIPVHPEGEPLKGAMQPPETALSLDTFAGKIQFKWAPEADVSSLGQMPFFIEYLKTSGLFENWVEDCPLQYTSPNAPQKRDVLGTLLLAVLAGHWRYAHISALRGDGVNPELLGMRKVASEDSVRRALSAMQEEESEVWLKKHLKATYEPLLEEAWALDVDTTVKPLYGHQEDAKVGYNPQKPGRPSHAYHSYFIANLRMVMDVEVQAGNQTAASFAQPELWRLLDGMGKPSQPRFLRGDCNWGTERAMEGAEQRRIPYVFKLKQSANVKKLIAKLFGNDQWVDAGQGWQGLGTELQLSGWSQARRVVVLRRPLREGVAAEKKSKKKNAKQLSLDLPEATYRGVLYEYAVLVTSLRDEVRTIAQHYRDRGDSENNFDELKNQWGWAGFTTHDRKRCQVMARITALIYNWWTIFMRLGIPDKHAEAITSRPLALHGIARRTRHSHQTTVEVTSTHSKALVIAAALSKVSGFLNRIKASAEQLTQAGRWRVILSAAFQQFLHGKMLGSTGRLAEAMG
jgi:Transposase DDE domain group 1